VTGIVPIRRLFEAHLTVSDLERSIAFYRDTLGLTLAHRVPERHAAFFWMGRPGETMLGLWSIHSSPMALRLHIAFEVAPDDVIASVAALRQAGLEPQDGSGQAVDEPVVLCWMPAASVYFKDPDGHSLEYIAMLPDRPRPDLGRMPLSQWRTLGPEDPKMT
jgi:lactoylglutathione lyase